MNFYNSRIFILSSIFIVLFGCKSIETPRSESPKYRHLRGTYSRNIAQDWTRPDKNTEVIPDIPHFQVLELEKFRKFKFTDLRDSTVYKGNWKIKNDTLILTYKNKLSEPYFIDMPSISDGACLKSKNLNESAFCK